MDKFVKPAHKGLLVRFPNILTTVLPESGANVPWEGKDGRYWRRRLIEGSIVIADCVEKTSKIVEKSIKKRRVD